MATSSVNKLLAKLMAAKAEEHLDVVPPGWMTREQLQRVWQKTRSQVRDLLSLGLKRGMIERKQFRVRGKKIASASVWHYREKNGAS